MLYFQSLSAAADLSPTATTALGRLLSRLILWKVWIFLTHRVMYEDEDKALSNADVGKFIPQSELERWWKQQQKKYPNIFAADEVCPTQHVEGTKLMQYEDDNPSRPIRVEVVGSRWRTDTFMGKQPTYIIKSQDTQKLMVTEVTSAHEEGIGWQLGWNVPPPTP